MLTKLEIEFEKNDDIKLNLNAGSLMQGALMELINPDYAEILHNNELKPYSQFLYKDREKQCYVWKICTLTEEAMKEIIEPLLSNKVQMIYLSHNNTSLNIRKKNLFKSVSYKDLANEYIVENDSQKKFVVKFLTPTTFNSQSGYINIPQIHNIYFSLMNKWNTFSKEVSLKDKDTLDHLINYTQLSGYKLRSTKFSLEGIKINAFMGETCFIIKGPLTLVSIANLLFAFSEYSGIGAKTALGMGGTKIE